MAILDYDIKVEQGATLRALSFYFLGPDPSGLGNPSNQVPTNFTGCSMKMEVREAQNPTSTLLLTLTSPSGGLAFVAGTTVPGPPLPAYNDGISITISNTQTQSLAAGTYYFDLIVTWPDTTTDLYIAGQFIVFATVTR